MCQPRRSAHCCLYIIRCTLQDLWGDVVGSTAHGFAAFGVEGEASSEAEVTDLDFQIFGEEEITEFEVPVDDLVVVDVLDTQGDLVQVVLGLYLRDPFAPLDQLVEGLVRAQLQDYVHVLLVLEEVVEPHDVVRLEGAVDLDFGVELHDRILTFSLALLRVSVAFSITFTAYFLLLS
jgi:hypothetical protein